MIATLRYYAKAVYTALATVLAVLVQVIATGELDRVELSQGVLGLLLAILVAFIQNGPKPGSVQFEPDFDV